MDWDHKFHRVSLVSSLSSLLSKMGRLPRVELQPDERGRLLLVRGLEIDMPFAIYLHLADARYRSDVYILSARIYMDE